jgi:hypothetical protein
MFWLGAGGCGIGLTEVAAISGPQVQLAEFSYLSSPLEKTGF